MHHAQGCTCLVSWNLEAVLGGRSYHSPHFLDNSRSVPPGSRETGASRGPRSHQQRSISVTRTYGSHRSQTLPRRFLKKVGPVPISFVYPVLPVKGSLYAPTSSGNTDKGTLNSRSPEPQSPPTSASGAPPPLWAQTNWFFHLPTPNHFNHAEDV